MGIFDFFKPKEEVRQTQEETRDINADAFFEIFGSSNGYVSASMAEEIPAVSACVEYIGKKVAMLPIYLYKKENGKLEKVEKDYRVKVLNMQASQYFDGVLFKKMLVKDYLLHGECHAYIKRTYNHIDELIYLSPSDITVNCNENPLNRVAKYWIQGVEKPEEDIFKVLYNSTDGVRGKGIVTKNAETLKTAYKGLLFTQNLIAKQGMKKGYLSAENKLDPTALEDLKTKWPKVYSGESDATMVLNAGVKFNELSSTAAEMQTLETELHNYNSICSIFGVAPSVLDGTAEEEVEVATFETAVLPVAKAFEIAFNNYLLLESEKDTMYFAFDYDEAIKGNINTRYSAYEKAVKNGILQPDEVREKENIAPLGLNFIKLGLQDVLYDPEKREFYVFNMGKKLEIGGEWINESGNKKLQR